jgi:8-oxo-dGTP diphosphatase
MEARQVFDRYQRLAKRPIDIYRYCPRCGAKSRLVASGGHNSHQCPRCGYVLYQNPSPGVVALIIDNDKVLLGKRARDVYRGGRWSLPGGFIEFDEDFLSAAHREIMEETGLSIKIQSIFSVVSNFLKPDLHTLVIVLLAEMIGGDLSPGDEMVRLEWFPLSGPFPDMAFSADTHVIERCRDTRIAGAPIDPRFATLVNND